MDLDTYIKPSNVEIPSVTQFIIDLDAISHNYHTIKKSQKKPMRMMPMIKAMAYGANDLEMARFFSSIGVDIFGVAYADEGARLRKSGIDQAIFVTYSAPFEAHTIAKWQLEVGACDIDCIQAFNQAAVKENVITPVHLIVNTGMNRFGCRPKDALYLAQTIKSLPALKLEGLMTHFATADDPDEDTFTKEQVSQFEKVIWELKKEGITVPFYHAANSSAALRFHVKECNMIRVGLALYGSFLSMPLSSSLPLIPAVSLVTRLSAINYPKRGDTIGYGRRYHVQKQNMPIGVIPVGYHDGIARTYSERGYVLVQGKKAPIIGNICMDHMTIDLSHIPNAKVGDQVVIFGKDSFNNYLLPETFAALGGTIAHELLSTISTRITRIYCQKSKNITKDKLKHVVY